MQEFLHGLLQPSKIALATTLTTAVTICISAGVGVTESWMVENGAILAYGGDDAYLDFTRRALELHQGQPHSPYVFLVGSRAWVADLNDAELAAQWSSESDGEASFVDLSTPGQSLTESLAIVDHVPRITEGVLAVVVSPASLLEGPEMLRLLDARPRLGLRSPAVYVALYRLGIDAIPLRHNYFIDNFTFLLSRSDAAAMNLWRRVSPRSDLTIEQAPAEHDRPSVEIEAEFNAAHLDVNLEVLDHVLLRLSQRPNLRSMVYLGRAPGVASESLIEGVRETAALYDVPLVIAPESDADAGTFPVALEDAMLAEWELWREEAN